MRISDILQEKGTRVLTIGADRNIHEAIGLLNKHRIGALVVTDEDEQVAGIITERDILRKCGECCDKANSAAAKEQTVCSFVVADVMTRELVIGVPDDDPNYVMAVMTKHHIRHLPILEDGKLAGILSIGDLVNVHLEEKVFESRTLKDYLSRNDTPALV